VRAANRRSLFLHGVLPVFRVRTRPGSSVRRAGSLCVWRRGLNMCVAPAPTTRLLAGMRLSRFLTNSKRLRYVQGLRRPGPDGRSTHQPLARGRSRASLPLPRRRSAQALPRGSLGRSWICDSAVLGPVRCGQLCQRQPSRC
jgi:hypothetical protein